MLMCCKSMDSDIYYTIEEQKESEIIISKSRFIGQAYPVDSKEKAQGVLHAIKSAHWDARHHCYAYVVGSQGLEYRFSDDGEPSGTGGKPIHFILNKYDFKDIIVVVTRYYGGVKLGAGRLARAYSDAAQMVLEKCIKKPVYITKKIKIFCNYEDFASIKTLLDQFSIKNEEKFSDTIEIISDIPITKIQEFTNLVTSVTRGRGGTLLID
jgi:uncharacterized YigZ family protein